MSNNKSGFAAVIGWTNVGKSTLLNRFIQQKIVITSPKIQTTRYATAIVLTERRGQIIFKDTPGIHHPKHLLNQMMLKESAAALKDSDLALHMVSPDVKSDEKKMQELLKNFDKPKILVVNKIDIPGKGKLLKFMERYSEVELYDDIVPVSATTGENVGHLLDVCFSHLPEGKKLYPEDHLSNRNERFFMAEILREKVIFMTRQELPYTTAVVIENSKWLHEKKIWHITAVIYVERDSQKSIIIGAKGHMLKEIGKRARLEMEEFLQAKVYLNTWVKVRKNWTRDPKFLQEIGYTLKG